MPVLPASVRVSLWASAAFNGALPLSTLASRALPDVDDVTGLTEPLQLWHEVGERVVLVALPRPGRSGGMPPAPASTTAAAADAQEAIYVPGLGGTLVPTIDNYGPDGDEGLRVYWTMFPSDPVPRHTVAAFGVADIELGLRTHLSEVTDQLQLRAGAPMARAATELFARRQISEQWGMPEGVPRRCARIIELAGSILALTDIGLSEELQSVDAASTQQREIVLRRLQDAAVEALLVATNTAAVHYAGWA